MPYLKKTTFLPLLLLFVCLLMPGLLKAVAGNTPIDSLHSLYRQDLNPDQRFIVLEKIARLHTTYYPDSSLFYSYKALQLANENRNTGQQVEAHIFISEAFFAKRLVDSSRSHYNLAIAVAVKNKSLPTECTAYRRMAEFYEQTGKRDSALFCLMKAYEISRKSDDKVEIASCLNSIGTFYKLQGDFGKALEYSMQSLDLWNEVDSFKTGGILSDIGNIYFQQRNLEEALKYYKSAYKVINETNDYLGLGYSLHNIGLVYFMQDQFKEALHHFLQSLRNYELAMNKEGIASINRKLGLVSYETGNYRLALVYGKRAMQISTELNNKELMCGTSELLAMAYSKTGEYKKAFEYQFLYSGYKFSAQNADMVQKVAEMQSRYEVVAKESENKVLRAETARQEVLLERQKHLAIFISIVLAMVIVISVLMFRTSFHRKKSLVKLQEQNNTIEAKNLELAALNVKIMAQKAQLEEASHFKDKLLSIVTHDFRSPLNSLQGFLMILSDDDLPKDAMRSLSRSLLDKVKTTSEFLDNLLSWAHSQLQGYRPAARNVNMHRAAEDVIELFKAQADAKGVKVINNITGNCEVSADLNMVKLVMRNLISNAIKYTSAGGNVAVSCTEAEGQEIIRVEDSGRGISKEDQKLLFSQQRFSTAGTANEKGTGLGLMLSKEFVERNGGQIWVESTPGKGSIFSFSIPAGQKNQREKMQNAGMEMAEKVTIETL